MSRPRRWTPKKESGGTQEYELSSWKYFSELINQELLDFTTYVYRGHSDSSWLLLPTLDRIISSPKSTRRRSHLENFQLAVRGRRGPNPPRIESENDWWALGQHNGLVTPLLDWTESPFVALYFAMRDAESMSNGSCCVWALSQASVREFSKKIDKDEKSVKIDGRKPIVELVRPMSDENSRLVNQRGLFTRAPNNMDLMKWINKYSKKEHKMSLMKITVPSKDSENCLKYLNRMNINHSTLFPDLYGASIFCNSKLRVENY